MSVTQIDDDAFAEAMRLSGAKPKKDTVNLALAEYAARAGRIAALERFGEAAQHAVTVLHGDAGFATAARHLPDIAQRRVRERPSLS